MVRIFMTQQELKALLEKRRDEMATVAVANAKNMDDLFQEGADSLIPIILKLAEALERIGHRSEPITFNEDRTFGFLFACEDVIMDANNILEALKNKLEP